MNTLTTLALNAIGALRTLPAQGDATKTWIDREATAHALGLPRDQEVPLLQTVGFGEGGLY